MKKHVLIALIALMSCMTAVGQDIRKGSTSLVVIEKEWEYETLSGVENNTLGAMLDCFDKRWPTWMVKAARKTMKKGLRLERNGDSQPVVHYDPKNGWVEVAMSGPLIAEFMKVCYWKRTNGHRLFALYFGNPVEPSIHFVCFYDYNPQNRTLTPEPQIIDGYRTTEDTKFFYDLPQEGKDLIISEFGPKGYLRHTFKWDGMKPVFSKTEVVEDIADGDHYDEDEE